MNQIPHDPAIRSNGNCLQCCLQYVGFEDAPHFLVTEEDWKIRLLDYIHRKGFKFEFYRRPPMGMSLGWGRSSRGHNHSVIMRDGELEYDPHPSGEGLVDVIWYVMIVRN